MSREELIRALARNCSFYGPGDKKSEAARTLVQDKLANDLESLTTETLTLLWEFAMDEA